MDINQTSLYRTFHTHRVVQRFLIGAARVNVILSRAKRRKNHSTITLLRAFRCIFVELKTFAIPANGSSLDSRGKRGFNDHLVPSNKRPDVSEICCHCINFMTLVSSSDARTFAFAVMKLFLSIPFVVRQQQEQIKAKRKDNLQY